MDTDVETNEIANTQNSENNIRPDYDTSENDFDNKTDDILNYDQELAEATKQIEAMEEQDKKLLDALDDALKNQTRKVTGTAVEQKQSTIKPKQIAVTVINKGVGFVSLGLILIFLAVVMLIVLFSPNHDYMLPLKLSPIAAALIGIEILFNQVPTRGSFKINIPSIAISATLVVGCCVMCVVLDNSGRKQQEEYNDRAIAAEIYEAGYKELRYIADIKTMTVDVDLNTGKAQRNTGIESLAPDDVVNVFVEFSGVYSSPSEFAGDCKKIIDGYRIMGINITNFYFSNESTYHSYKLNVFGKFAQDYSEYQLADMVDYVYIEDYDYLYDISDMVEETVD